MTFKKQKEGSQSVLPMPRIEGLQVHVLSMDVIDRHSCTRACIEGHSLAHVPTVHGIDPAEEPKVDEAISLKVTMDTQHQVGLACREVRGYTVA